MKFAASENFHLYWLVLGAGLFLYWSFKNRKKRLRLFADKTVLPGLLQDSVKNALKWKAILFISALLFLVFSLTRPQWGFQWEEVKQKGNDIFIAVDTSKSMLAQDVKPNRLERAKREIKDLIHFLKGDRVGLIAFAGSAFVLSPLTLDTAALRLFLNDVSSDIIPQGGTAIAEAIKKALQSFPGKEAKHKIIILITDGEDLEGGAVAVAEQARKKGVKIFTVGIGTPEGAPIPILDEQGNRSFVKDKNGQTVLSKLNVQVLSQLSQTPVSSSLTQVYEKYIFPLEKRELEVTRQKKYEEKFQWFLLPGILLLLLELLVRRNRKNRIPALSLILLLFLSGTDCLAATASGYVKKGNRLFKEKKWEEAQSKYIQAQSKAPESSKVQYNLGNTLYRKGQFKEAADIFEKALAYSPEDDDRFQVYYNLGNSRFRLGQYEQALKSYEQALELKPEDEDAKFNYELTKKLLEQLKKQQKEQQQQKQSSQKDQQKKEKNQQQGQKSEKNQSQQGQQQEQQMQPSQKEQQQSSSEQKQERKEGEQQQEELAPKPSEKEGKEKEKEKSQSQQAQEEKEKEKERKSQQSQQQKEEAAEKEQKKPQSRQGKGSQKGEVFTEENAEALLNALKQEELETRDLILRQRKQQKVVEPEKDW